MWHCYGDIYKNQFTHNNETTERDNYNGLSTWLKTYWASCDSGPSFTELCNISASLGTLRYAEKNRWVDGKWWALLLNSSSMSLLHKRQGRVLLLGCTATFMKSQLVSNMEHPVLIVIKLIGNFRWKGQLCGMKKADIDVLDIFFKPALDS